VIVDVCVVLGGCYCVSSASSLSLMPCACGKRAGQGIRPTTFICSSVQRSLLSTARMSYNRT